MKKILFLILTFFILTNFVNAQWPITQNLGSDSTLISVGRNFGGGIKGSLINKSYTDTTAANLSHADFYAGAQIFTTSDTSFWIRNKTATNTYWFKIGGAGGGATGSFWGLTGNYIAVTPANLGIGTNDPFNDLPFKTNNTVRLRLPLNGLERQSGGAWKPMLFDTTNLIWGYGDGGGTTPISSLTAATGSNSIDNGGFEQVWSWSSGFSTFGLTLNSNTTTASNNSSLLYVQTQGANGTAGRTTYSQIIDNFHTGTSSTNVGLRVSAASGTNNYAIIVPSGGGNVGIGTSTPDSLLTVELGIRGKRGVRFTGLPTFSDTSAYKILTYKVSDSSLAYATYWPGGGSSGLTVGSTAISGGTAGRILFQGSGNVVQQEAGLYWNEADDELDIIGGGNEEGLNLISTNTNYGTHLNFKYNTTTNAGFVKPLYNGGLAIGTDGSGDYIQIGGILGVDGKAKIQGYVYESGGIAAEFNTNSATTVGISVDGYASQTADLMQYRNSSGTVLSRFDNVGNLGIGTSPAAGVHVLKISEQLRLGYDASNYGSFTINSTGNLTVGLTGTTPTTTFSQDVKVPDEAFDATNWNASLEVPTKNAIRDAFVAFLGTGTYQPTASDFTNVSDTSLYACQYSWVVDPVSGLQVVTVSGKIDITPTAAGLTEVYITIPISSAFANEQEAGGTGHSASATDAENSTASIKAVASGVNVKITFLAADGTLKSFAFHFTYKVTTP